MSGIRSTLKLCAFPLVLLHVPIIRIAQWEFYHVISGSGIVRHESGKTRIESGDAFIFKPSEPHQVLNEGTADLIYYVVADNPFGESCYYPESEKWAVKSPEYRLIRGTSLDYYDGEE